MTMAVAVDVVARRGGVGVNMCKTLIVEDNSIFRQSLKEMLLSRFPGMHIVEAADAVEAVEKASRAFPDLIFIDIKLPDGNGLELTREMRKDHSGARIAIFSCLDIPEYLDAARRNGADRVFIKGSTSSNEIMAFVDRVVSVAE